MTGPDENVHIYEQGEAALREFAKILGTYLRALQKEGFTREEALALVIEYQKKIGGNSNAEQ